MYYPDRLVVDMFSVIGRCGVLLVLYWYVFRLNGGVVHGTTFQVVAWSMFFYFAFSILFVRGLSRMIMLDVQSGNVEVLFSKPISYLAYRMWWQIGTGLYPFVIISALGALVLALAIGFPVSMSADVFIPSLAAAVFLGTALSLSLYAIVGLFAFWIEDINPIFWMIDKIVMILGGSYLPVALFPDFMYKIAVYSPFGASQFVSHTVYGAWVEEWPVKLGIQIFWIIILAGITYALFLKARKKVSVNGG